MSEKDTLVVLGASYDSVSDAEVDYQAVKELYAAAGEDAERRAGHGHVKDPRVSPRGSRQHCDRKEH